MIQYNDIRSDLSPSANEMATEMDELRSSFLDQMMAMRKKYLNILQDESEALICFSTIAQVTASEMLAFSLCVATHGISKDKSMEIIQKSCDVMEKHTTQVVMKMNFDDNKNN